MAAATVCGGGLQLSADGSASSIEAANAGIDCSMTSLLVELAVLPFLGGSVDVECIEVLLL